MRILVCCADWGVPVGGSAGSSVHLRAMAAALSRLGHEVRLLVSNGAGPCPPGLSVATVPHRRLWPAIFGLVERARGCPAPAALETGGVSTVPAPGAVTDAPAPGAVSLKTRLYYETLPALADRVEECLVHPIAFGRAVSRMLADFAPEAVYERYALCQTGAAGALARAGEGRVPHILEVNASLARERTEKADDWLAGPWRLFAGRQEARLWRGADRVVCVSEALGRRIAEAGADPDRVRVVPNGVDAEAFSPDRPKGALRRLLGLGDGAVLIGWLGALSPGRGAEEFVRLLGQTLPQVPQARGVVIGGGPLDGTCRTLARELGLADRVHFTGPVAHDRVPDLLVDLDMAVACYPPQADFYFSPMKVAEYLACGLAVAVGRTGRADQAVTDGVSGLLVDPDAPGAFARALVGLCRDPDLRARLGAGAREQAMAGPTWLGNARLVEREIEACFEARVAGGGKWA
ncbi:glycosyl transferase group 1 [Solidesulfovibrio carbinoliphilus subsp. oakridgensis]|uniref:Glycosyl transferase group 1 n=1 Tax=Solidesulfovibrio carbinoliphilus subsp. oakridgensis TaxID=694327 RepID=G7QCH9_9BACT|nr:glycosyltransferase [Solidesulfovibrio carbinoliphilus]EHJ46135.1 glycosyl transferase group 1 [Solidesulfovibrio carbinoliphilus subsp. oakridgensis]